MINKSPIKNLFQKYHLRPSKRLGQNFLISQKALEKIIQTAKLSKKDVVLEVGPGLGILTKQLAQKTKKVIAVEKDKKMAQILKEILKDYQNVEIIQGDILTTQIQGLPLRITSFAKGKGVSERTTLELKRYKLVANIPYYLTSPLIRLFLEDKKPPQLIVLLIQKEVAQRICAQPPRMSLLAVAVQFYSQPQIISKVSKKCFWPQPKVDSAIIKIIPRRPVVASQEDRKRFFQIVKAGFSSPRKQLVNNLSQKLNLDRQEIKKALTKCGLNPQARAENLSIADWKKLIQLLG
jgi:16S rRNA (adenine1518-N6/adenine1519-N6)-dimethyltransferase